MGGIGTVTGKTNKMTRDSKCERKKKQQEVRWIRWVVTRYTFPWYTFNLISVPQYTEKEEKGN